MGQGHVGPGQGHHFGGRECGRPGVGVRGRSPPPGTKRFKRLLCCLSSLGAWLTKGDCNLFEIAEFNLKIPKHPETSHRIPLTPLCNSIQGPPIARTHSVASPHQNMALMIDGSTAGMVGDFVRLLTLLAS